MVEPLVAAEFGRYSIWAILKLLWPPDFDGAAVPAMVWRQWGMPGPDAEPSFLETQAQWEQDKPHAYVAVRVLDAAGLDPQVLQMLAPVRAHRVIVQPARGEQQHEWVSWGSLAYRSLLELLHEQPFPVPQQHPWGRMWGGRLALVAVVMRPARQVSEGIPRLELLFSRVAAQEYRSSLLRVLQHADNSRADLLVLFDPMQLYELPRPGALLTFEFPYREWCRLWPLAPSLRDMHATDVTTFLYPQQIPMGVFRFSRRGDAVVVSGQGLEQLRMHVLVSGKPLVLTGSLARHHPTLGWCMGLVSNPAIAAGLPELQGLLADSWEQKLGVLAREFRRLAAQGCAHCGSLATVHCAGCGTVHYCSQRCQRKDKERHKLACRIMRDVDRAAVGAAAQQ